MRVGMTYNLKSDLPPRGIDRLPEDAAEEFDLPETVEALRGALEGEAHAVFLLGGDLGVREKAERFGVEFVFNIAEGFHGRNREAQIPALLEMMGIPYSGSDPLGLAITLDKSLAKRVAISLKIPTPEFWVLAAPQDSQKVPDRFPLFVKPLWEGSSKGIRRSSCVRDRDALEKELHRLFENYPEAPALVEAYIPGREFTVGILGNSPPEIVGVMEIAFRDPNQKDFCYSLEVKRNWKKEVDYHFPALLDPVTEGAIGEAALELFKSLGLRDIARFDFRVNGEGKFYFLEANPLPGLSPESGDFVLLAQKKGWSYQEFILKIMHAAVSRYPSLNGNKTPITRR